MRQEFRPAQRTWYQKFRCAFRGLRVGVRGQSSFAVHFAAAGLAVLLAALLRVERMEWCVLMLCITIVLTAEMFNSALEHWRERSIGPKTGIWALPWTSAARRC